MARHRQTRLDEPTGAELVRLRKAYLDRDVRVSDIVGRFRLCQERLMAMAVREGWPLRKSGRKSQHQGEGGVRA